MSKFANILVPIFLFCWGAKITGLSGNFDTPFYGTCFSKCRFKALAGNFATKNIFPKTEQSDGHLVQVSVTI